MAQASQPWTKELIETVVRQVAPIVYLDKHEIYRPSSVEWYLGQVELVDEHGHVIIEQGKITSKNFPGGEATKKMHLQYPVGDSTIGHGCFPGCSPDPAVAYVHVRGVPENPNLIDAQYWFFYPFNGGGTLHVEFHGKGLDISLGQAGEHQGDWEHVTVRADSAGQIIGVYCSQHSDGQWYWEATSPGAENGYSLSGMQPVIYSAKNGHPSYPWVGDFPTEGSEFAVDLNEILSPIHISWFDGYLVIEGYLVNETSRGQQWNCAERHQIVAIDDVPGVSSSMQDLPSWWWLQFLGRWGEVHVREETKSAIIAGVTSVLNGILPLPGKEANTVATWLVDKVLNLYGEISPDGPTAPLSKGAWKSDGHGVLGRRPLNVYTATGLPPIWSPSVSLVAIGEFETDHVELQLFFPSFEREPELWYYTFKNGLFGGRTGPLSINAGGKILKGIEPCAVRSDSEKMTYLFYRPSGFSGPVSYTTLGGDGWSRPQAVGGIKAQGRLASAFLGETIQLFYQPPGTDDLMPAVYENGSWSIGATSLTSSCRGGASAVFYQDQVFFCWRDHDGWIWYRTVRSDKSVTPKVKVETGGGWSPKAAAVPQLAVVDNLLYLVWIDSANGKMAYLYFDGTEWQPHSGVAYGNYGQNAGLAAAATVGSCLYLAWPSIGYVKDGHHWLDLIEATELDV